MRQIMLRNLHDLLFCNLQYRKVSSLLLNVGYYILYISTHNMPTVVSAYYKIPSKAPHTQYELWLRRFFRSISVPTIFFASAECKKEFTRLRVNSNIQFVCLPFEELTAWKYGREFWERQKQRDEETYHTVELAAVWYEKKEFVARAMKLKPEEELFIWCDAGCIRTEIAEASACKFGTRTQHLPNDTLFVQRIGGIPAIPGPYSYPTVCLAGAIQVGTRKAWATHSNLYDSELLEYDKAGVSGNSDQYVILSCIQKYPQNYTHVYLSETDWFAFLTTL